MPSLKERLTETERAYLAGIFDGEGCVGYYKRRGNRSKYSYIALVAISQTDFRPIHWLQEKIQFGTVVTKAGKKHFEYQWSTNKKSNVYEFLDAIIPYLILKKEQAETLLAHLTAEGLVPFAKGSVTSEIVERRENIYTALRQMKIANMVSVH